MTRHFRIAALLFALSASFALIVSEPIVAAVQALLAITFAILDDGLD